MKFSPDGRHLLSGVGDGRIYVDGATPPGLENLRAGGWDWLDADGSRIGGNAWFDGVWQIVAYDFATRQVTPLEPLRLGATDFYGGNGYVAWNAGRPPFSFDSEGHTWTDRCALARSPEGDEAYCDLARTQLILRVGGTAIVRQTGPVMAVRMRGGSVCYNDARLMLHAVGEPDPLTPASGSVPTFCQFPDGSRVFVSWVPAKNAVCLFPWQISGRLDGWVLSADAKDFTPDITLQPDGLIGVGTGENAGETIQRWYEVDWPLRRMRRKGRSTWNSMPMVDLSTAPVEALPIPVIGKRCWLGGFSFISSTTFPGNCDFQVHGDGYIRAFDGRNIAQYASGADDSDVDELEAAIAERVAIDSVTPVMCYWTAQAQAIRVPKGAKILGVEAYLHVGEQDADFIRRVTTSARKGRSWLIPSCYTSNANNSTDLVRVAALCAQIARDEVTVEGLLVFSGSGRATGYQDHPDVWAPWHAVAAGIVGTPSIEKPPMPKPPAVRPSNSLVLLA